MIFRQDAPSRDPVPQPQALPCAQRLPRERFRSMAHSGDAGQRPRRRLSGVVLSPIGLAVQFSGSCRARRALAVMRAGATARHAPGRAIAPASRAAPRFLRGLTRRSPFPSWCFIRLPRHLSPAVRAFVDWAHSAVGTAPSPHENRASPALRGTQAIADAARLYPLVARRPVARRRLGCLGPRS
jgi:hypothetical protein